jgi:serine/threonine-protein kinase
MGSVYRAEHTLLKKHVALKIMDPMLLSSSEARQRFLREAQAAAAIKHPNVVAITDTGVIDGIPYLVMELLDGIDLEQHLERNGPLSDQQLAALALPVVAALGVAHDTGVVHRDLKPGNIFLARGLDGEVVPKVLDFGVSKFSAVLAQGDLAMTPFDQLMGSPLYLPPEAVHGARELTPHSDQYSLAVVLYECVTGKTPFVRESLLHLLNAIAQGRFDPPRAVRPETSVAVERVILRAMSPDPAARFEHIRDLGRALLEVADIRTRTLWGPSFGYSRSAALMEPSPTPSGRQAPEQPPTTPERGSAWRSWAGLGLTLAGIGLVWTLTRPDDTPSAPSTETHASEPSRVAAEVPPAAEPGTSAVAPAPAASPEPVTPEADAIRQPTASPARSAAADGRAAAPRNPRTEVRSLRDANRATAAAPAAGAPPRRAQRSGNKSSKADDDVRRLFFPQEGGREGTTPEQPDESAPLRNEAPILD